MLAPAFSSPVIACGWLHGIGSARGIAPAAGGVSQARKTDTILHFWAHAPSISDARRHGISPGVTQTGRHTAVQCCTCMCAFIAQSCFKLCCQAGSQASSHSSFSNHNGKTIKRGVGRERLEWRCPALLLYGCNHCPAPSSAFGCNFCAKVAEYARSAHLCCVLCSRRAADDKLRAVRSAE